MLFSRPRHRTSANTGLVISAWGAKWPEGEPVKIDQLFREICAIVNGELGNKRADDGALGLGVHFLTGLWRGYAETQMFGLWGRAGFGRTGKPDSHNRRARS